MKEVLAYVAGVLIFLSVVPYMLDILKRKTKPNIVTWSTWTILIGIATAASFAAHQPRSGLLTLFDTVGTFMVVLLGLRYGIAKMSMFDAACQAGAILGLVLWILFNSPLIALFFTISIDLVATLPTFRHSWLHPEEETWQTFVIGATACTLSIISLQQYRLSGLIMPIYLLFSNLALLFAITYSRKRKGVPLTR